MHADIVVREATPADLAEVRRIQRDTPEAAQWDLLDYRLLIAQHGESIKGFLSWRFTAPNEAEILNLAVSAAFRRRGVAHALLRLIPAPDVFLEVRESNHPARNLYRKAGFQEVGIRFGYYSNPAETGIVMRWQS